MPSADFNKAWKGKDTQKTKPKAQLEASSEGEGQRSFQKKKNKSCPLTGYERKRTFRVVSPQVDKAKKKKKKAARGEVHLNR